MKIFILLLSFFGIFELSLQVKSRIKIPEIKLEKLANKNQLNILAIGDSVSGVYPEYLSKTLVKHSDNKVKIHSHIKPSVKVSEVFYSYPEIIKKYSPNLVLLMIGHGDLLNKNEKELIAKKENSFLYKIQTFVLIKNAFENYSSNLSSHFSEGDLPDVFGEIYDAKNPNPGEKAIQAANWKSALSFYQPLYEQNKSDYSLNMILGETNLNLGNFEQAIKHFKVVTKNNNEDPALFGAIAYCFQKSKQFDEAIKWNQKGLDLNPNSGNNLTRLVEILWDQGLKTKAKVYIDRLINDSDQKHLGYYHLGNYYFHEKSDFDKALENYLLAFKAGDKGLERILILQIGHTYNRLGEADEALKNFKEALLKDLTNENAHFNYFLFSLLNNRMEGLKNTYFEELLPKGNLTNATMLTIGRIYLEDKEYEKAYQWLNKAFDNGLQSPYIEEAYKKLQSVNVKYANPFEKKELKQKNFSKNLYELYPKLINKFLDDGVKVLVLQYPNSEFSQFSKIDFPKSNNLFFFQTMENLKLKFEDDDYSNIFEKDLFHLTKEGNILLAKELFNFLKENNLLKRDTYGR